MRFIPKLRALLTVTARDVGHFLAAFLGALIPLLAATSQPLSRAVLIALVPAAASVAFRKVWPNANVTSSELATVIGLLNAYASKLSLNRVIEPHYLSPTEDQVKAAAAKLLTDLIPRQVVDPLPANTWKVPGGVVSVTSPAPPTPPAAPLPVPDPTAPSTSPGIVPLP